MKEKATELASVEFVIGKQGASAEEIEYFLSTFKQSIDIENITSNNEILNSSELSDTKLIWSNLTKSLEVRSESRSREINADV